MTPTALIVSGTGKSGSWVVRGEQLGAAIGATVQPRAQSFSGYQGAILVKRPPADLLARVHAARIPVIYDVVDAWPQPEGNRWERNTCMEWLRGCFKQVRPRAVVVASQVMAHDCAECTDPSVKVLVLPHHSRPEQGVNPVRETVRVVGYEGGEQYLGIWRSVLLGQCAKRGWTFVVNPPSLAQLDIVVAVREHTGYAARSWKSNIKLANAQATGTPCVLSRETAYIENASGAENWAGSEAELSDAFDELSDYGVRRLKSSQLRLMGQRVGLESVAATYKKWLCELNF